MINKVKLENIFIFAILYCNHYNGNRGRAFNHYISEKSCKFLGFDITNYTNVNIDDFCNRIKKTYHYKPAKPHEILQRIKNKVPLEFISDYSNVKRNAPDILGFVEYNINGLDYFNKNTFIQGFENLSEDYFIKTLRDINLDLILSK